MIILCGLVRQGQFYHLWKTSLYNIISSSEAPARLCDHIVEMLSESSVAYYVPWLFEPLIQTSLCHDGTVQLKESFVQYRSNGPSQINFLSSSIWETLDIIVDIGQKQITRLTLQVNKFFPSSNTHTHTLKKYFMFLSSFLLLCFTQGNICRAPSQ